NFEPHSCRTFMQHVELLGRFLAKIDHDAAFGDAAIGDENDDVLSIGEMSYANSCPQRQAIMGSGELVLAGAPFWEGRCRDLVPGCQSFNLRLLRLGSDCVYHLRR